MGRYTFAAVMIAAACLGLALAGPASAGIIGDKIIISQDSCWFPDVSYDSVDQKYLVVWSDYNYSPQQIRGQFITNGGALSGSQFAISSASNVGLYPAIAYNSTNNEFLVCWIGNSDLVYGRRVRGSDGALLGSEFQVSSGVVSVDQLAWNAATNTYLSVFYAGVGGCDVRGQRISSTGGLLGGEFNITNDSNYSSYPDVNGGYGSEFLVTWDDEDAVGATNIRGRRVDASSGALLGSVINVTSGTGRNRSHIAFDSVNNRYCVQFNDLTIAGHSFDQAGQIIGADGSLIGGNFFIASTAVLEGDPAEGGDIAFVPGYQKYFSVFTWDINMGGQELTTSGGLVGGVVNLSSNTLPAEVYRVSNAADTNLSRYLAAWQNWSGSVSHLHARLFEATSGNPPPGPVTSFVATAGNGQNVLTWANPTDPSFTGTLIRFKTTGYPTGPTDGTQIYNSTGTNYTHSGLTNGVTYYYTAWAHDAVPNYAAGVNASAMPSATPGLLIIPQPQELTWKAGTGFLVNSSTQIMANSSPDAKEINMANQLQRKVWDMTGYLPAIVYGGSTTSNVIAVGDPARCPAVSSIIATWSEASGKASKSEGYMLGIKDTSIVIRGFDNAGSFYGSQTLIQLLEYFGTTRVSPVFAYDYPELAWRGTYFRVKFDHDFSFSKELMAEMFARYKMNRMMPDAWMVSISHPEIPAPNEDPAHAGDVQDWVNFCKLHYITDIGACNFGNPLAGSLNDSLRENPSLPQDDPLEQLCQRNPGSRTLKEQLWMDGVNLLGSQYVHTGQSEYTPCDPAYPWDIGWSGCSYCSGYSNQWLFNDYMWQDRTNLYVNHGVTPVVWGDMLRADYNGGPTEWNTSGAVATMPSETIIFDWEYGSPSYVPTDYPSLDTWIANGQRACGTPYGFGNHPEYGQYYGDIENIYYWANAVYNRSLTYPQYMLGIVAFNKYCCYSKRDVLDTPLYMDFLECFPFYSEWGWNPNGRYWSPRPYVGQDMVRRELSPDRVSNLTATPASGNVNLAWTNPPDSTFAKTYIVYRIDREPTSPIDGTYLADVAGSPSAAGNYTHVGAPAQVYYGLFAHDLVRHFSPAANAQVGGVCFNEPFSYSDGALNGNGGWSGTATSSQIQIASQAVKINGGAGAYDAVKTVSCSDPGTGYIVVTVKINGEVGDLTMWNLWIDDSSARNFARWYGSGTTARGRIGGTANVTATQTLTGGWDTLKVKLYPATNNTEFFFNGVSIGTLSHATEGTADVVGQVRFERIDSSGAVGQYLYFDDLVIGEAAADTTPPGPVTSFVATGGDAQVSLSWANPGDADFAGTMVRFKTTGYPTGPTDGTQVYSGTGTSTVHTGLTNGVSYYYAAYAFDGVPNYSTAAQASAVPSDTTAPGPVTSFAVTPGEGQNSLSWVNPGGDFTGTKILFKTTGYPTSPTDGTSIYDSSGTSTVHSGLTNGVTYYYSAYAHDEVPNYSTVANAYGTPASEFCYRDQFSYGNGALVGNGGWTGTATASHVEVVDSKVRIWGGATEYYAIKTINCTSSPSGYIWVRLLAYPGTGAKTMWDVWFNDASGKNFARWYGTGTTARGRIGSSSTVTVSKTLTGGGVWDSLVVKIDPAANTSQFYFNGIDLGTYSHASQGPGDVLGQIKVDRSNNSAAAGHNMYIDDIRVSPY